MEYGIGAEYRDAPVADMHRREEVARSTGAVPEPGEGEYQFPTDIDLFEDTSDYEIKEDDYEAYFLFGEFDKVRDVFEILISGEYDQELTQRRIEAGAMVETTVMTPMTSEAVTNFAG